MSCLGDCWDLGPPPDTILYLPPPPAPSFLQSVVDILDNASATPCAAQLCDWIVKDNHLPGGGEYVELPRQDIETTWSGSNIDDTWLLVLVISSIGVLLLGALLALFLMKCREEQRQSKHLEQRDCTSVNGTSNGKMVHPSDTLMYPGGPSVQDNRMVWAALTPHGTQHFISENYPRVMMNEYTENEDHYETIDNLTLNIQPVIPLHPQQINYNTYYKGLANNHVVRKESSSFDNSGFVDYDYDYEDPTPLIESYQLSNIDNLDVNGAADAMLGQNTDMRCVSLSNTLRRGIPLMYAPPRPTVSSPTRIEHPNLPPLNLHPTHHRPSTLKRNTLSRRRSENNVFAK